MRRVSAGRRWLWVFLGSGAFALHVLLGTDSAFVERGYSRGIFIGIRWLWDYTLGLSPFPLLYIFLAVAVVWDAWMIFRFLSRPKPRLPSSVWTKIRQAGLLVASWAGMLVFFFYVLWGLNYNRLRLEKQLNLDVVPLDLVGIKAEAAWTVRLLAETRALVPGATSAALTPAAVPPDLEAILRKSLSITLKDAGYPSPGRVRIRPLWPGGLIMRFSSTGFYFPYFGEGYIAGNLMPSEKPFVTAHEMVHAFGITDEGGANLLGFLACQSAPSPIVRYSGLLSYWSYVYSDLVRASRKDAERIAASLPEGVRADIRAAQENWDRYRGPLRKVARGVYERYLKSQGVEEGIKSYDRFVALLAAWKRRNSLVN
jgi:hypothetical protein